LFPLIFLECGCWWVFCSYWQDGMCGDARSTGDYADKEKLDFSKGCLCAVGNRRQVVW